jgi:hypothetical protein
MAQEPLFFSWQLISIVGVLIRFTGAAEETTVLLDFGGEGAEGTGTGTGAGAGGGLETGY